MTAMKPTITLAPIGPQDEAFLYDVYASTRQEELAVLDWDEAEKEAFLRMQFQAQHSYYADQFADAAFDLIVLGGRPVGRLYLDRRQDELRIIDIALLPEYRRQGIGTRLLKEILAEAQGTGLPVRIHVERNNPALGLYRRLGFRKVEDQGIYYLMEWRPGEGNRQHVENVDERGF
jgi:ribosomal protein S18 acetylase RimI-like enzyme